MCSRGGARGVRGLGTAVDARADAVPARLLPLNSPLARLAINVDLDATVIMATVEAACHTCAVVGSLRLWRAARDVLKPVRHLSQRGGWLSCSAEHGHARGSAGSLPLRPARDGRGGAAATARGGLPHQRACALGGDQGERDQPAALLFHRRAPAPLDRSRDSDCPVPQLHRSRRRARQPATP